MDVTQSRREVRVMPVATEEAVTQRGPLPQNFAGPWSTMLPMQQVSNREMEGGTRRPVTAGGSLSQGPVRRTESGVLGRCKTCKYWGHDYGDNEPRWCNHNKVSFGTSPDSATAEGNNIYTGPEFGCVHYEERA